MRHATLTKWLNLLLIVFLCFTACKSESQTATKAKTTKNSAKSNKKSKAKTKKSSKRIPYKVLKKDKSGKMMYNDQPFSGVTFKSSKGKTLAEISYKNGVKHGSYISYRGGAKKVTEFKNGKKVTK